MLPAWLLVSSAQGCKKCPKIPGLSAWQGWSQWLQAHAGFWALLAPLLMIFPLFMCYCRRYLMAGRKKVAVGRRNWFNILILCFFMIARLEGCYWDQRIMESWGSEGTSGHHPVHFPGRAESLQQVIKFNYWPIWGSLKFNAWYWRNYPNASKYTTKL